MLTCALEVDELLSDASLSSIPEETVGFTFWEAIITLWNEGIAGLFCKKNHFQFLCKCYRGITILIDW